MLATGVSHEGYGSRLTIEPTQVNIGHIFEEPNQDAHVHHPTKKAWQEPSPNGATTTLAVEPLGIIPR